MCVSRWKSFVSPLWNDCMHDGVNKSDRRGRDEYDDSRR
jgi:hypothetical protein